MKYGKKKDRSPGTRIARYHARQEYVQNKISGTGRYRFKNRTKGVINLPKPAENGQLEVAVEGKFSEFIGDNYFLSLVPDLLIIVEDLSMSKENKLLTEQPPTVTQDGKVEYIQQTKPFTITESKPNQSQEILLTEDPAGGIVILE